MTTIKELEEKKKHMEFIINYLKGEVKQIEWEIQDSMET